MITTARWYRTDRMVNKTESCDEIGLHVVHYMVVSTLVPRGTVLVHQSNESQVTHKNTTFIQSLGGWLSVARGSRVANKPSRSRV